MPEGSSFDNPANWVEYLKNREWVFRVVWAKGFTGMNDNIFPVLVTEAFRMCNVKYLEWWFGFACSHYNRLTRQRFVRELEAYPTAVTDTKLCKALWVAISDQIYKKNLDLIKQLSFKDRNAAGSEGYKAWSIAEDRKKCPGGAFTGSTKEPKPAGGGKPSGGLHDPLMGGGKGGGKGTGRGEKRDEPSGEAREVVKKLPGGNPASTKYCGQHLIGLLNLGDKCERKECHFHHPSNPGKLEMKKVEDVCDSPWARNFEVSILEKVKEEASEAISRAGGSGKGNPVDGGDATDSETPAKKKLRWADFKARKKEKAKVQEVTVRGGGVLN